MADRWFRFERRPEDGRLVLLRRGPAPTGNADLDLWRDPGAEYTIDDRDEPGPLAAALLADLLTLLSPSVARPLVRAYLARDPEAAAKVAGAWERTGDHSSRRRGSLGDETAIVKLIEDGPPGLPWFYGCKQGGGVVASREEGEQRVDEALAADRWTLGNINGGTHG